MSRSDLLGLTSRAGLCSALTAALRSAAGFSSLLFGSRPVMAPPRAAHDTLGKRLRHWAIGKACGSDVRSLRRNLVSAPAARRRSRREILPPLDCWPQDLST